MKTLRMFGMAIVAILLCTNFSACSDDDDDDDSSKVLMICGHEAVDLGLSVKWATCNVGAKSPEDYGGYYAWGEREEKSDYNWDTYKWYNDSYDTMTKYVVTKYCTSSSCGTVDGKTVLAPYDDVVYVKWGGSWRMPTLEEIEELVDECTWKWTELNGIKGNLVVGPSGKSIFLPAAGYHIETEFVSSLGGMYWSATLSEDSNYTAYYLSHSSGDSYWSNANRSDGFTVRPVTD